MAKSRTIKKAKTRFQKIKNLMLLLRISKRETFKLSIFQKSKQSTIFMMASEIQQSCQKIILLVLRLNKGLKILRTFSRMVFAPTACPKKSKTSSKRTGLSILKIASSHQSQTEQTWCDLPWLLRHCSKNNCKTLGEQTQSKVLPTKK